MANMAMSEAGRSEEARRLRRVFASLGLLVVQAVAGARAAGRGERLLAAMSDHQLRDLGLDRGALAHALLQ